MIGCLANIKDLITSGAVVQEAKHAEQREAMRYLREEFAQRQAQALRNKAAVEADRGNIAIYIPAGPPPPRPDRDDRAGAARRDRNRHVAHGFVVGPADTHSGRTALEPPAVENCVPVMRGGNQNGQERAAIENFPDVKGERRSRGDDELTPEQRYAASVVCSWRSLVDEWFLDGWLMLKLAPLGSSCDSCLWLPSCLRLKQHI